MYAAGKLFIICLITLTACQKEGIPKSVLTLTQDRLEAYRQEQDSICQSKVRLQAEVAVDSFFLSLSRRYLLDSISIPLKPIKPSVDTNINLDHTTPVKPLWDTLK
ncbi:MAG: hypothetical protein SH818_14615 [Saprospiraceae bacterium]|nr:hypothetical protein [Saprospiraceae bacterium]